MKGREEEENVKRKDRRRNAEGEKRQVAQGKHEKEKRD